MKKFVIPITIGSILAVSWTIFNFEKITIFEGPTVVNFGGKIEVPVTVDKSSAQRYELHRSLDKEDPVAVRMKETSQSDLQPTTEQRTTEYVVSEQQDTVQETAGIQPLNDKASTATLLQSGMKYSGNLTKKFDSRYYSLSLEEPTAVNFAFNASGLSAYSVLIEGGSVSQQNSEKSGRVNILTELYNDSRNIAENFNVYLRSGSYLVRVTGGKIWRDKSGGNSFSLTMNTSQNTPCEAENNGTLELANLMNVGSITQASSYKNDVDYFTFNLDRRTTILPKIEFTPVDDQDLKLYDLV